jgi:ankyrin repeat protein
MQVTDSVWQRGLHYLISTQDDLGAWRVRTRMISPAPVSPPYFETGFPYERDQFLSMTGSCWAAMALIAALPKAAAPAFPLPVPELTPPGLQPWMTTALFGTVGDLNAQLDAGLDPNSKTAEGTTLLMMAANDAGKVKLLVSRGADARSQAKTGFTALHVASTYGGTAESLKALLESGLLAQPGSGVMFNASPLMFAVQAGDRANVALLLAHGADVKRKTNMAGLIPSSVLATAVVFGNVELAQMLLTAGANPQEKDANDMSLLHRAALGNHADMVKLLVSRGVSVNAVDRFGFTPLLYASTVDFGDAKTTKALLASGADPNIKDQRGAAAWEHAREFPYIRAALERAGARR